jgi:peptidoglycan/LPS O-acetylase OafA/YrhL
MATFGRRELPMSGMTERVHLSGIEICRAVAAFAVVVWHFEHFFQSGLTRVDIDPASRHAYPFYSVLFPFYGSGYAAVQIFWTISGVIFYWKYSAEIHRRMISLSTFSLYRISRLYPLHLVTLLVVALLQFVYFSKNSTPFVYVADWSHFFPHLLMASNWLPNLPDSFNGPVWSVSIEVLAYLAFFLVVRFFRPSLLQCVIGAVLARGAVYLGDATFGWPGATVFHCLQFFFSGGIIHFLTRKKTERSLLLLCCIFSFVALAVAGARLHGLIEVNTDTILAASFAIVGAFHSIPERFIPFRAAIASVGNLTYSSYMVHFPIQLAMVLAAQFAMLPRDVFYERIAFLFYIAITFGLAYVSYRFLEVPAQRAIRSGGKAARWKVMGATPNS